jgi:hypothetical protein
MSNNISSLVYGAFQDANPEKFNEDLIYMRKIETIEDYFKDIFRSLKIPGITYLSCDTITDESKHADIVPRHNKAVEESRVDLISAKFFLELGEESKEVTLNLFFPKLIDDFFFYLAGNRYFALYQIADKNFYGTKDTVYLKTLLMPLGIKSANSSFEAVSGNTYGGREYTLDFFKSRGSSNAELKNLFYFFFVEKGVDATIDYFFNDDGDTPNVFLGYELEEYEDYDCIQVRKDLYIHFRIPAVSITNDSQNYLSLLCTLNTALKSVRNVSSITEELYWKKKILNSTNTTNISKADKAIVSLKRVLDERTKRNLNLPAEFTEDTFATIKWMCFNYEALFNIDTVDVYNRRLRLFEYMLYPLLTKFSDASYRILNSRNMTLKKLETVFSNIRPNFLLKNLINNELLRYSNSTSTLEVFSVILRFSARGPQALGGGGGILLKYRGLHPSYVGNIGLNMASASDPGITGTLSPLSKNIKDMQFVKPSDYDDIANTVNELVI